MRYLWLLLLGLGIHLPAVETIAKLKPLYLETDLARAVIVAPAEFVPAIRKAVGLNLPVRETVEWPLKTNVIAAGTRENNRFIDLLYRRHFCFTDAAYPGPGGYELRSIHNPSGGGFNVILLGGEVAQAIPELAKAVKDGKVGHLMKIALPPGTTIPEDYSRARTHQRMVSIAGLCRTGWGWNPSAYELALFYQTGDPKYARRFLEVSFPDAATQKKYAGTDAYSDPKHPLASAYHYNGGFNILLWDLVEESPVFTDAERLAVTREFLAWAATGYDGVNAAGSGNDRHGTWQANCRLALARYFDREYPSAFWHDNLAKQIRYYDYLRQPGSWVQGERCIPNWLCSGSINPSLFGMNLAGLNFAPASGYGTALAFFEAMYDGSVSSPYIDTAARSTFFQLAGLTGDGKWLYYADRLPPIQPERFKIGQSFTPDPKLKVRPPEELCGRWLAVKMPEGVRRFFRISPDPARAFLALSYRDRLGIAGDLLSFENFSGEYRTPFHAASLFNCRIDGQPLLRGFTNFLTVTRDGLASREIPTYGEVETYGADEKYAWITTLVKDSGLADWRRRAVLRKSRYLVIGDEILPHQAGTFNYTLHWELAPQSNLTAKGDKISFDPMLELDLRKCEFATSPAGRARLDGSAVIAELDKPGDWLEISFPQQTGGDVALTGYLTRYLDRADAVDVTLNGRPVRRVEKLNDPSGWWVARSPVNFYRNRLHPGRNVFRFTVAAAEPGKAMVGVSGIEIKFSTAGQRPGASILTAGAEAKIAGKNYAATCGVSAAAPDRPVRVFSLLAGSDPGTNSGVSIAPNAALFVVGGERLLVWSGRLEPFGEAELAILSKEGLYASKLVEFNGRTLAKAADVDWPAAKEWDPLLERLRNFAVPSGDTTAARPKLPELAGKRWLKLPGAPDAWAADGDAAALASGKKVMVFNPDGSLRWEKELANPVTALGFFAPGKLLLAGTAGTGPLTGPDRLNTRIWAFDQASGAERWNFHSEDPAGNHPYHNHRACPGIFAFATFGDRIAVGSASTLELLNPDGSLWQRYLQNYGRVRILTPAGNYLFCERTDHSPFIQAWRIDAAGKAEKGWNGNFPGFKSFPGFGSMYRTRLFAADFDGDGETEILGDGQGMYLWLNMYTLDGKPKRQINLGPGDPQQRPLITALAVGDLGGSAAPEIVLGDKFGRLAIFDGKLQPCGSCSPGFIPVDAAVLPDRTALAVGEKSGLIVDGAGKPLKSLSFPAPAVKILVLDHGFAVLLGNGEVWKFEG